MSARLAVAAAAGLLCGCATVINGTSQRVEIVSTPAGASALVLPGGEVVTTPATVRLERLRAHTVRLTLAGYETETEFLDRVASGAVYGNLILGGVIGIIVDSKSGGAFQLVPKKIEVTLRPVDADPPASAPPEPAPR